MFRWGKRKRPSEDAIELLKLLDAVILKVHPDRFFDRLEAGVVAQPCLVLLNRIIGTPEEYRFRSISFDSWVAAVESYRAQGLAVNLIDAVRNDETVRAMIAAGLYEQSLKAKNEVPNAENLRQEVRSTAETLLMFLNRFSQDTPER